MESDSSSSCGEWSYFPGIIPHLGAWSKKENIDSSLKEKFLCQKQSFFVVEHGKCFMFNVILRKQCKGRHIIVSQGHFSGDTIVFFLTSRGQRAQLKYVDREQISSLTTSSGMCSKQSAVTGHNFRRHIPGLQALNDSCVHSIKRPHFQMHFLQSWNYNSQKENSEQTDTQFVWGENNLSTITMQQCYCQASNTAFHLVNFLNVSFLHFFRLRSFICANKRLRIIYFYTCF